MKHWLATTHFKVKNFTMTDSLVFTNNHSPSKQENKAFCQKIKFKEPFFLPPVIVVSPAISYSNKISPRPASGCSAVTAWVQHTSIKDTEVCTRSYNNDASHKETIRADYMVIGDLDPCLNVTCLYHGVCKAFGPYDGRCVCIESCSSYQEPVCISNGTTYDNKCLFEQDMCRQRLNFTLQHPGSCEGFPIQHGRLHMPHIPSLGYSHCQTIHFKPYVFYPDKPVEVQVTVNHMDTRDKSYVHDAAVSWVEIVNHEHFTACVMAAGFNERKSNANVTVDWMAYQGAAVGGVAGKVQFSQWWTGTTCKTVKFPRNWLAFSYLDKPPFSEHDSIYFANDQPPVSGHNNAFCKDVVFANVYNTTPHVFVSANHSTKKGNQNPIHNSITAWLEYINETAFGVCVKELYEEKYDPLSISYTVLSDICPSGWGYFNGFCYRTTSECATWLTAVLNCSAMESHLVTVHNQEENVYIQHRHNGESSWIGLNDRSIEGSFVWANKVRSTFRFWAPQQPNNRKNEDCVHTLGAKNGYKWNDVACDRCYSFTCFKEIDECTTNYHRCDANSVCQNTVGTYICACKSGYAVDGKKCIDIDECGNNTHKCHANAVCNNTDGSYKCTCNPGYSGDGRKCSGSHCFSC